MSPPTYAPSLSHHHTRDTSSSDSGSSSSDDDDDDDSTDSDSSSSRHSPRRRTPPPRSPLVCILMLAPIFLLAGAAVAYASRDGHHGFFNGGAHSTAVSSATSAISSGAGGLGSTSRFATVVGSASKAASTSSVKGVAVAGSSVSSAAGVASTKTASAAASTSTRKVFAHILQVLSQFNTRETWNSDIALAKQAGIDGFALDVEHAPSDAEQMKIIFDAAKEAGDFALFFSFDMNAGHFGASGSSDILLNEYLIPYANHEAHYKVDGKSLVSTFAGDTSSTWLENSKDIEGTWSAVFSRAAQQDPSIAIHFVPCLLNDKPDSSLGVYDGAMRWYFWPLGNAEPTVQIDEPFVKTLASNGQTSMLPVGAFFSTHYNPDTNYITKSDDWLLPTHYKQIIEMETQPDWIELLTWNDYSESHYLGPIHETSIFPGTSGLYVNSTFDHTPMLTLSSYYNAWYKTGAAPSIATETIIWWYRPHPTAATAWNDTLDRPRDVEWLEDNLYAAVLIPESSSAASLVFTTGGEAQAGQPISAGVNLLKVDFNTGTQSIALLDGSGKKILSANGWSITGNPETYNYNYWCGIVPADATPATMLG